MSFPYNSADIGNRIIKPVQNDAVERIRTSNPQSLIDTDFEYSLQSSKWETLELMNNTPSIFLKTDDSILMADQIQSLSAASATSGLTLNLASTYTPSLSYTVGTPIVLVNTLNGIADGVSLVIAAPNIRQYTLSPRKRLTIRPSINYATAETNAYLGGFYTTAPIPFSTMVSISGTPNVLVTTTTPHNFFLDQPIWVIDNTRATDYTIGAFNITQINGPTSFTYVSDLTANLFPASDTVLNTTNTRLYVRPEGYALHRATDGGVQITSANNSPNSQIIRQTRNYFRYQSGKSILFSTGLLFKPSYDIRNISVDTTAYNQRLSSYYVMIIGTEQPHGFAQPSAYLEGASVRLRGLTVQGGVNRYNTTFTVASVGDQNTFTVLLPVSSTLTTQFNALTAPTDISPDGLGKVDVIRWNDAVVRTGLFDEQNGIFFECDGNKLSVVKRSSTNNMTGTISVAGNSTSVIGTNTKFESQLRVGDYIVIRGMSYYVSDINSDTSISIVPKYTGQSIAAVRYAKTEEVRFNQEDFNLDKLDGTGPSGYTIDLNKMQMLYFDYSWYGAGRVRWGVRATEGHIIFCHQMKNNNVNLEAYMRSGNLPARFEVNNKPQRGYILQANQTNVTMYNTLNDLSEPRIVEVKQANNLTGPYFSFRPRLSANLYRFSNSADGVKGLYSLDNIPGNQSTAANPYDRLYSGAFYSSLPFSTTRVKFGTHSVRIEPTYYYNSTIYTGNTIPAFPSDFTVELFVYFDTFQPGFSNNPYSNANTIFYRGAEAYHGIPGFGMHAEITANSKARAIMGLGSYYEQNTFTSSTSVLSLSTWHHVVLQRLNGRCEMFVDGVSVVSATNFNTFSEGQFFFGGMIYGNATYSYLDDIRITQGFAQYPFGNFTPPTQPLTQSGQSTTASFNIVSDPENRKVYYKGYDFATQKEIPTVQTMLASTSCITVSPSATFMLPSSGTLLYDYEYMRYSKLRTNSAGEQVLRIDRRNVGNLTNSAGVSTIPTPRFFPYNNVLSFNQNCSPALSHWGTSVIMDGGFTPDKSYLFTAGTATSAAPTLDRDIPLISVRLAPAVDYGIGSFVGVRNLINRSILVLNDVQIVTRQALNVTIKLNCESSLWPVSGNWINAGNGSLSQYLDHTSASVRNTPVSAGVVIGGFLAGEQDSGRNQVTDYDINLIRNLGNSILGGNTVYPDGPDILTVFARPVSASPTNQALCKVTWTEAQG
jgi:hypothetical protein